MMDKIIYPKDYERVIPKLIKKYSQLWDDDTTDKMQMLSTGGVVNDNEDFPSVHYPIPFQITIAHCPFGHNIIIWYMRKYGSMRCKFIKDVAILPC